MRTLRVIGVLLPFLVLCCGWFVADGLGRLCDWLAERCWRAARWMVGDQEC